LYRYWTVWNPIKQFDKLIVSYANSILLEKKYTF
jgi:hypothetical protein